MTQSQIQIPTQAQIDAGVGRGRRMQSEAIAGFFAAIGALFTSNTQPVAHTTYGNGAR